MPTTRASTPSSTCYNSEEGVTLAEMMAKEQDWVVIFNLKRIEEAVQGRQGPRRSAACPCSTAARARPTPATFRSPNSPHGINTAPDGIHFVANGKLSPTVTVFDVRKLDDLFDDKIQPRDVVVAEPELGLGPLHTAYDGKGNAYTTLFLDSQVVQVEHRRSPSGPSRARRSIRSSRSSTCTTSPATTTPPWARPRRRTASG